MNDDKIFKRPIGTISFHKNSKRNKIILKNTINNIKTRVNGVKRIPLPTFINPAEDDKQVDETREMELSFNSTTTHSCADCSTYGRCLGYHSIQKVHLHESTTSSDAANKFDTTLNESTMLGKSTWINQLNRLPQWAIKEWLEKCPVKCDGNATISFQNAAGMYLSAMINESMNAESKRSSILARISVDKPTNRPPQTPVAIKNQSDVVSPDGYTSRVRIQKPPNNQNNMSLNTPKSKQVKSALNKKGMESGKPEQQRGKKKEKKKNIPSPRPPPPKVQSQSSGNPSGSALEGCSKWVEHNPTDLEKGAQNAKIQSQLSGGTSGSESKGSSVSYGHNSTASKKKAQLYGHNSTASKKKVQNAKIQSQLSGDTSGSESEGSSVSYGHSSTASKKKAQLYGHNSTASKKKVQNAKIQSQSSGDTSGSESEGSSVSYGHNSTASKKKVQNAKIQSQSSGDTSGSESEGSSESYEHNSTASEKEAQNAKVTSTSIQEINETAPITEYQVKACHVVLSDIILKQKKIEKTHNELEQLRWIKKWKLVCDKTDGYKLKLIGCLEDEEHNVIEMNHVSPEIKKRLDEFHILTEGNIKYSLFEKAMPKGSKAYSSSGFPKNWQSIPVEKMSYGDEEPTASGSQIPPPKVGRRKEKNKNNAPKEYNVMEKDLGIDNPVFVKALTTKPRIIDYSVVINGIPVPPKSVKRVIENMGEEKHMVDWKLIPVAGRKDDFQLKGNLINDKKKVITKDHISPVISKRQDGTTVLCGNVVYKLVGLPKWDQSTIGESSAPDPRKKFARGFPSRWSCAAKEIWKEQGESSTSQKTTGPNKERAAADNTDYGSDSDDPSKDLIGVTVSTSSRGRKKFAPIKYYEGEQVKVSGSSAFVKKHSTFKHFTPSTTKEQDSGKMSKVIKPSQAKYQPKSGARKRNKQENKTGDSVQAKKARVAESTTSKTESQPNKRSDKLEAATVKKGKAAKPEEAMDFSSLDDEEISDIMKSKPKNKKDKDKRDGCMKWVQNSATHKDKDLFVNFPPTKSDEEANGDPSDVWDTESTSSRVASDDDRMKFNYTPPGDRMSKLVKSTPHKHDATMEFDDKTNNNKRSRDFIQRQLKKPRGLSKKQREKQATAQANTDKLMKYMNVNTENNRMVSTMFQQLTSGTPSQKVKDYINTIPEPGDDKEDSDTPPEQYYTDDEDQDDTLKF